MAEKPVLTPEEEAEQLLSEEEPTDEPAPDPEPEDPNPEDDPVKAALEKKDRIIRQLTARLHKGKQPKPADAPAAPLKNPSDDLRPTVERLALAEEKRQFGHEHGLTPAETDAVFRINPKPTKETLEDPFVKGGLQAIRAKKRAESNTPPLGTRGPRLEMPKKENATPEDKQAAFERFRDSRLRK